MPKAKRERRERTDNYHLLQQWCRTPEQRLYEGIRPITLFGFPPAERAQETGLAERSLGRAADVFERLGYAHFRRWKLYGEEALARHPTVIWLHGDALTVEYQETPLAQYTVRYQPDKKHFKAVPEARRFETPYRSLQGWLWELDETLWHLARRLPDYAPRKKRRDKPLPLQLPLLEDPPVAQE
jgi:hypothetical protein